MQDEHRSGRPRCTDEAMDTAIAGIAFVDPFVTPRQLKRQHDIDASTSTIKRRLVEAGLHGRVAHHGMAFTDEHRRKRLSLANGYSDWSEEKWETVLFTDEKSFCGAGSNGQVWVRRPVGEELKPDYCVDHKPHPVKVNAWGSFSGRGLGYLYIFNINLDATLMLTILRTHLIESAERSNISDGQWWLLQDNDPKHKSKKVDTWIKQHGVDCIDFPPYSPDLNPIENLWNDVARRVEKRQATTMELLQEVVAEEWAATSTQFIRTLAHSMPARCQAVINANGNHTSY